MAIVNFKIAKQIIIYCEIFGSSEILQAHVSLSQSKAYHHTHLGELICGIVQLVQKMF